MSEYSPFFTITSELVIRIQKAIEAVSSSHHCLFIKNETVEDLKAEFEWLQNWAFTQGFVLTVKSQNKKRLCVKCVNHHKKTKSWQKIKKKNRVWPNTVSLAKNCSYALYISYWQQQNAWLIGLTCITHNHSMKPDPFQFWQHHHWDPTCTSAFMLEEGLQHAEVSYSEARKILQNHDVCLSVKDYYNLKQLKKKLTNKEALKLLLDQLDLKNFQVWVMKKYIINNKGNCTQQVVQHIFFCFSEQINLAKRFVSGFCMQTDAMFNTNKLHLPLSVIVEITNTFKTFLLAFCFIISESTEAFKFMNTQLKELMFYDRSDSAVIVENFSKSLDAVMTRYEEQAKQADREKEVNKDVKADREEMPEGLRLSFKASVKMKKDCILQLCEWHAVEAIKKRLVVADQYIKKRQKKLINYIWDWVKSFTITVLKKQQEHLLMKLKTSEREYLTIFYQLKKPQFIKAYIKQYFNLDVHFTQWNESYHVVVKAVVHQQLSLPDAVHQLHNHVKQLVKNINKKINRQRKSLSQLMNKKTFQILEPWITHQALALLISEWEATKLLFNLIESGCMSVCELLRQWGLSCKHWMYSAVFRAVSLPLSLMHLWWFLNASADVSEL